MKCFCKDVINRLARIGAVAFSVVYALSFPLFLFGVLSKWAPLSGFLMSLPFIFLYVLTEAKKKTRNSKKKSPLGLQIGLREKNMIHPANVIFLPDEYPDLHKLLTKKDFPCEKGRVPSKLKSKCKRKFSGK